jgi:glycosyltransferase involved in cell wall biosynthesis
VLFLVENVSVPADARVWPECLALKHAGFDVAVICPQGRIHDREELEVREGIAIHRFPLVYARGGPLTYLHEYTFAFWHTWRLARRLSRQRSFAVVHAANPPDFLLLAVWPLKGRGARFIFDQHDLVPELYVSRFGNRLRILYWLTRALERLSFALADVVISPNNSYRSIALRRGKKEAEDVVVVRNGPDPSVFRPIEPDLMLKRGKPHLLAYVGTMNPQDGLDYAIRALSILKGRRTDWHAVFVGDGDAAADARKLAADLGLHDLVHFTGVLQRPDVVCVLSTADICLSPEPRSPLNEVSTFIKIAEYMSMERPVVAFDLPESRFSAGAAAAYAAPNDAESFARRIDELLDDPGRRAAMGRLGRARVVSELSWEQSRPTLLAAYDRVLRNGLVAPGRRRVWSVKRPS